MSQYPPYPPGYQPPGYQPQMPGQDPTGKATAGLVLGIIGMIMWCVPLLGLPINIIGLILASKGMKSSVRGQALAGLVLSIIGLVLTVINGAIGAYMGATGRNPFVNSFLHH